MKTIPVLFILLLKYQYKYKYIFIFLFSLTLSVQSYFTFSYIQKNVLLFLFLTLCMKCNYSLSLFFFNISITSHTHTHIKSVLSYKIQKPKCVIYLCISTCVLLVFAITSYGFFFFLEPTKRHNLSICFFFRSSLCCVKTVL